MVLRTRVGGHDNEGAMMSRSGAVEVDDHLLRNWALAAPGSDKNSKGGVLIIGGSRHTPGAVLLSAEAALRAGAAKVQVMTVRSTATALAVASPELLVAGAHETPDGEIAAASAEPGLPAGRTRVRVRR